MFEEILNMSLLTIKEVEKLEKWEIEIDSIMIVNQETSSYHEVINHLCIFLENLVQPT